MGTKTDGALVQALASLDRYCQIANAAAKGLDKSQPDYLNIGLQGAVADILVQTGPQDEAVLFFDTAVVLLPALAHQQHLLVDRTRPLLPDQVHRQGLLLETLAGDDPGPLLSRQDGPIPVVFYVLYLVGVLAGLEAGLA